MNRRGIWMWLWSVMGLVGSVTGAVRADTIQLLSFDVNDVAVQAWKSTVDGDVMGFDGKTHTGKLVFNSTSSSTLVFTIDPMDGPKTVTGPLSMSFGPGENFISFDNGVVTGGTLTVQVQNDDLTLGSFVFDVLPGTASLQKAPMINSYSLSGYILSGAATTSQFANQDLSGIDWASQMPAMLTAVAFRPSGTGEGALNLDITAVANTAAAPLPAAVWGGGVLLGGIAMARARKWMRGA